MRYHKREQLIMIKLKRIQVLVDLSLKNSLSFQHGWSETETSILKYYPLKREQFLVTVNHRIVILLHNLISQNLRV